MDPDTGNAQYLISGGLSGGFTDADAVGALLSLLLTVQVCGALDSWLGVVAFGLASLAIVETYWEEMTFIRQTRLSAERQKYWEAQLAAATMLTVAEMATLGVLSLSPNLRPDIRHLAVVACCVVGIAYVLAVRVTLHAMIVEDEQSRTQG